MLFSGEAGKTHGGGNPIRGNLDSAIAEAEANADAYEEHATAARKGRLPDVAEWFESVAAAEHAHVAQLSRVRQALDGLK